MAKYVACTVGKCKFGVACESTWQHFKPTVKIMPGERDKDPSPDLSGSFYTYLPLRFTA